MSRVGVLFAILLIAPLAVTAAFPDIAQNPDKTAIEYLHDQGIIDGYPDGSFHPERMINRAELLKILIGSVGVKPSVTEFHDCFPDVKEEWFAPFVCLAKDEHWISGYPDGTFRPAQTVTMEEAIKMSVTVLGLQPMQSSAAPHFSDVDPSAWYAPYISIAKRAGMLDGIPGPALGIGGRMNRGIISDMIYRSISSNSSQNKSIKNVLKRHGGTAEGPRSPVITFADISKNWGDGNFTVTAVSNSSGRITYSVANTSIATVNGSTVTIRGAGSTGITATQEASGDFTAGSKTASLTVAGIPPTITFGDLTKSHIDANFTLSPTSDSPGAFTFTSGDTGLVAISGSTADIVGVYGTTTVTAHQAASGNYAARSASMTLTVFFTYCVASPCFGGACTPVLEGALTDDNFSCTCFEGYSGAICDEYSDNCSAPGYCNSGDCIADSSGGSCANCAPCLTGDRCQTAIINCEARAPVFLACVDLMMSHIR